MSAEEIVSLLCDWLVTSCGLLIDDGKSLAKNLVHIHKVTSLSSLKDILQISPDFLVKSCDTQSAYCVQIVKHLRQHFGRDLETLTAVEVSTVLFNVSFSPSFCREILRCGISGFILTTVSIEDIMEQCSAATANVSTAVFTSVVSRLQTQGVPASMLSLKVETTEQIQSLSGANLIPIVSEHIATVSSMSGSCGGEVVNYSAPPLGSSRKRPLVAEDNTQNESKKQDRFSSISPIKPVPRTTPPSDVSDSIVSPPTAASCCDKTSEMCPSENQNTTTITFACQPLVTVKSEVVMSEVSVDKRSDGSSQHPVQVVVTTSPTEDKAGERNDQPTSTTATIVEQSEMLKMTSGVGSASDVKVKEEEAQANEAVITSAPKRVYRSRKNRAVSRVESNATSEDSVVCGVLQDLATRALGSDPGEQTGALKAFIKMFPAISTLQVRRAQEFGLIKRIFDLARSQTTDENVMHLSMTALSHVITKEQDVREYMFQLGVSRLIVDKIRSSSTPLNVKEHCMWMAGYFVCTDEHREILVGDGIITTVTETYDESSPATLQSKTVQMICNLLRTRPALAVTQIRPLLPIIAHNLDGGEWRGVADAMAALYFITLEEGVDYVGEVFALPRVVRKVVQLTRSDSVAVCAAAEKVIENLSAGSVEQTKQLMTHNILPGLVALVRTDQKKYRQRMIAACRTVRNLCEADEEVVGQVVAAGMFKALVALCPFELEEVIELAVSCVCNAVQVASPQQVTSIVAANVIPLLVRYLQEFGDTDTTVDVLGALENILNKSENIAHFDSVIRAVYNLKGWLEVDELRKDSSPLVSDSAKKINIQRMRDAYLTRNRT